MTEKEWDPESWNGDVWGDPNEPGDIDPLNSDESSFPVGNNLSTPSKSYLFTPSEGINPTLAEETVRVPRPQAVAMQDNSDSPQDPPTHIPFTPANTHTPSLLQ